MDGDGYLLWLSGFSLWLQDVLHIVVRVGYFIVVFASRHQPLLSVTETKVQMFLL